MVKIIEMGEITRPATTPLTSTLFDHAEVKDIASFGLRNNEGLWPSYNCMDTLVPSPTCADPIAPGGVYNTFVSAEWQPAFEFAVHAGVMCASVGLNRADMEAEVRRVFALNEAKGVEAALVANRFVATGSGDPVQWAGATDVTPTAPVSLPVAPALLEGYAAANYAGVPTIHMPRAAATILADRLVWVGGKAYTLSGSKVALGGGYDDETMLDSGKWDLYATGEVFVERSSTLDFNSFVMPGDGSGVGSDENGLEPNTMLSLVARQYRVAVDCFVAKATGTVWS